SYPLSTWVNTGLTRNRFKAFRRYEIFYHHLSGANLGNEPIFELAPVGGSIRPRRRLRLHPAGRVVADRDPDRGGHVGGDRSPAAGAARFRRRPLRSLASLYADDVFARLLDDCARAHDRPL